MLGIIVFFAIGILIGYFIRNRKSLSGRFALPANIFLGFLIFMMGVSLGDNLAVIGNIGLLGLKALALTLGAILGSILLVAPFSWLFKEKE
jgi:uncharacterized membrane protein YbjE (DUF340 family)